MWWVWSTSATLSAHTVLVRDGIFLLLPEFRISWGQKAILEIWDSNPGSSALEADALTTRPMGW